MGRWEECEAWEEWRLNFGFSTRGQEHYGETRIW